MTEHAANSWSWPDAERVMSWLRALSVLAVTAIAAVQSYMHIVTLAERYGQDSQSAHLLPLSVDGLVAAASFQLVLSARRTKSAAEPRWWHRYGLGPDADPVAQAAFMLGVVATLAANVAAGIPHGWPGAAASGWPAIAFVVAAEMAIGSIRRDRRRAPANRPLAEPQRSVGRAPGRGAGEAPAAADRAPSGSRAAAAAILAGRPDTTGPELAAMLEIPQRSARRYVSEYRPPEPVAIAAGNGAGHV